MYVYIDMYVYLYAPVLSFIGHLKFVDLHGVIVIDGILKWFE